MNTAIPQLVETGPLPFLITTPSPVAHAEGLWPILFFLHGFDEGAPTPLEKGLTRHGPLKPTSSPEATSEFIVVAPQLPMSGDFWHRHGEDVATLLQQVQREFGGDPERAFLTGFSFGGNGVFDLGLAQPNMWRALWAVDPTRVPHSAPNQPVWLSSGKISRYCEERFISSLNLEHLQPNQTEQLIPGQRIYFDQMQDHVGTATLAYADDRIYQWLLNL